MVALSRDSRPPEFELGNSGVIGGTTGCKNYPKYFIPTPGMSGSLDKENLLLWELHVNFR